MCNGCPRDSTTQIPKYTWCIFHLLLWNRWLKSTGKTNSFIPPLKTFIKSVYSWMMGIKGKGISDVGVGPRAECWLSACDGII